MMPGPIRDFIGQSEFHTGLLLAVALAAAAALWGAAARRRGNPPPPIGGVLIGAGFAIGIAITTVLPWSVFAGLVLLGIAGLAAAALDGRDRALLGAALAVPGAIVLSTHTGSPRSHWVALLVVLAVVGASPLVADFDRRFGVRGWPLVLYAISAVGVYYTVPDTERALVLLGVGLPIGLLGWPVPLVSLGPAGSYIATGTLVWVAAFEGRGRHAAIVGAIACLGLLVAEPAARLLRRGRATVIARFPASRWGAVPVALVQLALVFVASRVAGVGHAVGIAALVVVCEMCVAVGVLWVADVGASERHARGRLHTSR